MDCGSSQSTPSYSQPAPDMRFEQLVPQPSPSIDSLANKISELSLEKPLASPDLVDTLKNRLYTANINKETPILRLPLDVLGVISSHLPEFSEINPFFQSCAAAFILQPELIACDPFKASQFISACCNEGNQQRCVTFLTQCASSCYENTKLYLSLDGYWDKLPETLQLLQKKFPNLVCLDLTGTAENTKCIPWSVDSINTILTICPRVEHILLSKIAENDIYKIRFSQGFTQIECQEMKINGRTISHFLELPNKLTFLKFEKCEILLSSAQKKENRVHALTLSELIINKPDFQLLLSFFDFLSELSVINCKTLESDSFTVINSSKLKRLNLSNSNINDQTFTTLCKSCPNLEELTLLGCSQLTAESFKAIVFPATLRAINIDWTAIDDQGLENILYCCRYLQKISVNSCKMLKQKSLEQTDWPASLQELEVKDTQISTEAIRRCQRLCPFLFSISR